MDWTELVALIRAGDSSAAPLLVSSLSGRLDAYADLRARDLSQADREEAVERALAAAVKNIEKYDSARGTFLTWVRAIVRRELAETRRSSRASPVDPVVLGDHLAGRSTGGQDPTAEAALATVDPYDTDEGPDRQHVALTALLLQLSAADAALVQAHVHEQLTFPQIAERLGPPATAGNLRQRFNRLRKRVVAAARQDSELAPLTQEKP